MRTTKNPYRVKDRGLWLLYTEGKSGKAVDRSYPSNTTLGKVYNERSDTIIVNTFLKRVKIMDMDAEYWIDRTSNDIRLFDSLAEQDAYYDEYIEPRLNRHEKISITAEDYQKIVDEISFLENQMKHRAISKYEAIELLNEIITLINRYPKWEK